MNKKWICLVLAALLVAVSMMAVAEQPSKDVGDVKPSKDVNDVPTTGGSSSGSSSSSSSSSGSSSSGSSSSGTSSDVNVFDNAQTVVVDYALAATGTLLDYVNVTVASSNENVTVSVPTALPSAAMAQADAALAAAASVKDVISAELAATAQMILGSTSLDDLKPLFGVLLSVTVSGDDDATVRINLATELAETHVAVGTNILGLVTMIKGGAVSYDVASSTYQGAGQVDVNFTSDQLKAMADADEVMYTLLSD